MTPYISGRPTLHLRDILPQRKRLDSVFPLNQERCLYFYSARYALAAAVEALGLGSGDKILVPSYNCKVELDPLAYFNIKPVFYRINKDLHLDFDDILRKIPDRVKAILVTHFLGFPQPIDDIAKMCQERSLLLIEDCAHAFLSTFKGHPLGSFGDAAIFSLLKTLPVPNGGLLILKSNAFRYNEPGKKPSLSSTLFYMAELANDRTWGQSSAIRQSILRLLNNTLYHLVKCAKFLVAAFRKLFDPTALFLVRPDSYSFVESLLNWRISNASRKLLNNFDFDHIRRIRRRNFQYLLEHFTNNNRGVLLFKQLLPGVCPLFFPIIVKSPQNRNRMYLTLKSRGIITHPWWDSFHPDVPWDAFPDAVYLKQRLFGLPIHQDLQLEHLDHLINAFEEAYQSLENSNVRD